jgi:hypothetical protein
MIINFRAERLNIAAGVDHVTVTYECLVVSTTSRRPGDAIPMGPITTDNNDEVTS